MKKLIFEYYELRKRKDCILEDLKLQVDTFSHLGFHTIVTHDHQDHTTGLRSSWNSQIISSVTTSSILENVHGIQGKYIDSIKYYEWKHYSNFSVMLFPAFHVPGSCMVLIRDHSKNRNIFHTGDFRYSDDLSQQNFSTLKEQLKRHARGKISEMFIDLTYCHCRFKFCQRSQIVENMGVLCKEILKRATDSSLDCYFVLGCYRIGKEELVVGLSHHLETNKICVDEKRHRRLESIDKNEWELYGMGRFLNDIMFVKNGKIGNGQRMLVTDYHRISSIDSSKRFSPIRSILRDDSSVVVLILPSCFNRKMKTVRSQLGFNYSDDAKIILIRPPLSSHSSTFEAREFLKFMKGTKTRTSKRCVLRTINNFKEESWNKVEDNLGKKATVAKLWKNSLDSIPSAFEGFDAIFIFNVVAQEHCFSFHKASGCIHLQLPPGDFDWQSWEEKMFGKINQFISEKLDPTGEIPIVFSSPTPFVPEGVEIPRKCAERLKQNGAYQEGACDIQLYHLPGYPHFHNVVRRLSESRGNVKWVDLDEWYCPGGTCKEKFEGVNLMQDRHHVTRSYYRYRAQDFLNVLAENNIIFERAYQDLS